MAPRPSTLAAGVYGPVTYDVHRAQERKRVREMRRLDHVEEIIQLGLGVEVKIKYPPRLMPGTESLYVPVADVSRYLATAIRKRVTVDKMWSTGPARHYSERMNGGSRRMWVRPSEARKLKPIEGVEFLTAGEWAGWAICKTAKVFEAAGGDMKRGLMDFVATGELWYQRLTVGMRGPGKSQIYFAGAHSSSGYRKAEALAARLSKQNPTGLLAVSEAEMSTVRDMVRASFSAQLGAEIRVGQQVYDLQARTGKLAKRASRLLGG